MKRKYLSTALGAAALALISSSGVAATGEQWEYQGTMEMMGVKMPIQPTKRCQGKDEPMTPPMESNCQLSDVHRQGNTTRFAFRCSKPDEASGSGTVTVMGTTLQSDYKIKSPDGEGTVKLTGKKLGECKYTPQASAQAIAPEHAAAASAGAKQGAAADAAFASAKNQAASIEKQYCGSMVQKMSPQGWFTEMDSCIKQKPAFCKRMKTDAGLRQFAVTAATEGNMDPVFSLETISDECGVGEKVATRAKLCKLSNDGQEWHALRSFCAEPFRNRVMTHCAVGQQSELETTLISKDGPQYDSLCKLADGGLAADVVKAQHGGKPGEATDEPLDAGMKAIKGILKW